MRWSNGHDLRMLWIVVCVTAAAVSSAAQCWGCNQSSDMENVWWEGAGTQTGLLSRRPHTATSSESFGNEHGCRNVNASAQAVTIFLHSHSSAAHAQRSGHLEQPKTSRDNGRQQLPLTRLLGHEGKYVGSRHYRGTLTSAHQWTKCMFLQTRRRRLHQLPGNMTAQYLNT